jgi:ATP-dependent RNA helicase DeaD
MGDIRQLKEHNMITFENSGLREDLLRAIKEMGFEKPTEIQGLTIPQLAKSDEDLIALAQTGTGKTAAFGLPLLNHINADSKETQGLILCPTRELCLQVAKDIENYAKYYNKFRVTAVYGGASAENQIKDLNRGAQVVVGTPGRTLDLIKRRKLKVGAIRVLVLDEADEMLSMGFKDDLDSILENTPSERQTLLFSATMPTEIVRISKNYMNNPIQISAGKRNVGATNVDHEYYVVKASDRYEALKRIADMNPNIYGIVFCRTRRETKEVADKMMKDGYNADALHGDLSQAQRDHVMNRFRNKVLQILVATDVAARGLDVNELTHVINYNQPDEAEIYIHRSGRTGRAGNKGVSISIMHKRELNKVSRLEKIVGKKFKQCQVPSGRDICGVQLFNLIGKMEDTVVDQEQIGPFMEDIYAKLNDMSREDLIQKFVSVEFNRFLAYYKNARDLNAAANERGGRSERGERGERFEKKRKGDRNSEGFVRFHINVGSKNNVAPPQLIGLINDATQTRNIEIGRIEILKKFSFFEVPEKEKATILKSFEGVDHNGVTIVVEEAQAASHSGSRGGDRSRSPRKGKSYGKSSGGSHKSYGRDGGRDRKSSRSGGGSKRFSGRKGR